VHRFHQVATMYRDTFVKLRSQLVETGGLKNSLYQKNHDIRFNHDIASRHTGLHYPRVNETMAT
jgi:hypothetical protein